MLDKKHFWAVFLFEIKWAKKQRRQFSTSTVHLAQELLMNVQCSGSSGSFTKETKSLEDDHSGQPSEVDNNQMKAIVEADPLRTTQEVAQELSVNHSVVIWHLKHIRKVEKLDKLISYAAAAKSLQSCPTLSNPIEGSQPGSSVPGILQARILE